MRKIALLLVLVLTFVCFAGCSGDASDSDLAYVQEKGKLVVGVTVYEPMNYKDENGNWTSFDTEFAQAVGKELDVEVEFVVIDWKNKWNSLNAKKIDVVWNGMTLNSETKANANCTDAYVLNAQVVVMSADKVNSYKDAASMKGLNFAVENGSAGLDIAKDKGFTFKQYASQSEALTAVKTAKADACIIDITMAKSMTGAGTSFADLGIGISLTEEEYAIACRKDSDLTDKINEIMAAMKADGSLQKLADKYQLTLAD